MNNLNRQGQWGGNEPLSNGSLTVRLRRMLETICKNCGQRYQLGTEHKCKLIAPKGTAASLAMAKVATTTGRSDGRAESLPARDEKDYKRAQSVLKPDPVVHKFDKVAYQREYMRKRRAKAKEAR